MIKLSILFFFFFFLAVSAQEIPCLSISEIPLNADRFIGVDDFDSIYYVKDNVFYKKENENTISYTNFQMGNIGNIDILNPLEITIFYPDFNVAIKLDNTLNEIIKIDFNQIKNFRNIQYVTTANDKNLWIFNADMHQLEVFNYQTQGIIPTNQPLHEKIIAQESDYNFCWLLTEKELLSYNIYGSLLSSVPLEGYDGISQSGNHEVLKKKNTLFYKERGLNQMTPLKIIAINIKDFYINEDNLYIYNGKNLYHYKLNFNKKE
jgi:hypothetical protein